MINIRLIPVEFIVEQAKALQTAAEALPLRQLIAEWFKSNHHEAEGYLALNEIDEHFAPAKVVDMNGSEPVVLQGCVLGRFRTNQLYAQMLASIIHEIHRRMNIPIEESLNATRPEDVRQDSWTWPHVMRVMIRRGIIKDNTKKSPFGAMIEQVLGNKVKKGSIRRTNHCDFSIAEKEDYSLTDQDKEIIKEITSLFLPLFMPKDDIANAKELTFR
jgi:hypothetical protein